MTLATEISDDLERLGYAGKTPQQIVDLLNVVNREVDQDINIDAFNSYLLKRGKGLGEQLDAADKATALAMGKRMVSRAQELGFGNVTPRMIDAERAA